MRVELSRIRFLRNELIYFIFASVYVIERFYMRSSAFISSVGFDEIKIRSYFYPVYYGLKNRGIKPGYA
jgi:hypothetical protein